MVNLAWRPGVIVDSGHVIGTIAGTARNWRPLHGLVWVWLLVIAHGSAMKISLIHGFVQTHGPAMVGARPWSGARDQRGLAWLLLGRIGDWGCLRRLQNGRLSWLLTITHGSRMDLIETRVEKGRRQISTP